MEGNDSCAHQAGGDHNGGGGGLDDRGHDQPQEERLDGGVGGLLQGLFQGAGGTFLQAVPHNAHSV